MRLNLKKLFSLSFVMLLVLTAVLVFPAGTVAESIDSDLSSQAEARTRNKNVQRNTLYVGAGQTYSKIQDAVDNASAGDTVMVLSGTYYENVVIDKTLTLIGNGSANTIINGSGTGSGIIVKADWCNVSGFYITNSGSGWWSHAGIILDMSEHSSITNVTLTGNKHGILLFMSNYTDISDCQGYYNTWNFINFSRSENNIISNCSGFSNTIGFDLHESNYNSFQFNDLVNNKDIGIRLHFSKKNTFIFNNITNSKNQCVWIGQYNCYHNGFYLNNFINNNQGKIQAFDKGNNKWNLTIPPKGNHWSDWVSPDNNSDGFVDSPYVININKRILDWYPLVNPTGSGPTPPQPQPPSINNSNVITAYVNQLYSVKYYAIDPDTPQTNLTWSINTTAKWLTFDSNQTLYGTPTNSDIGSHGVQINVSDGALRDSTDFYVTVYNRSQPPNNGTVLNVRTQVRYKTISKAVNEAQTGDKIKVFANTYTEDVVIGKSLTLEGEAGKTILQANSTTALYIWSVNTTISGFTIKNSNTGILLDGSIWSFYSFDINIFKCTFIDNTVGLKTMYERGFSIYDCTFKTNNIGIELKNSYISRIYDCAFEKNTGYGINILGGNSSSDKITIWNNTFNSNNGATSKYNSSKVQAKDDVYKFYKNNWNSTSGFGNFWSDWLAPDNNKDGIVDVPYNITGTAGSKDHRPRTNYIPPRTFPPQIITQNKLFAYVGKQYISNYSATDPDTPMANLTWSVKTNASWLKTVGNIALVGTPSSSDVGTYWVSVSVTDGDHVVYTNFTLTVLGSAKPQITTPDVTIAYVGVKYSVYYTATDQDTPQKNLTWSMKSNASWLTFSSTQELYGTPAKTDIGSYWLHITVSDGKNSNSTNFTITVISRNQQQKTNPSVNSTYPNDDSYNVSVNDTIIKIEFTKPMNTASVARVLSISPNVKYTLKWEKNNTILKIIFTENLTYNTTYKISIGMGAFDFENNFVNSTFELVFTTEHGGGNGKVINIPKPDEDWGALLLAAGAIIVVIVIIIFLIILAFVTKNRRRWHDELEQRNARYEGEEPGLVISNGTDEMLWELKTEALGPKKPSTFGPSENKMMDKLDQKYKKGELSKETYEMIKQSMLENIKDQKP